MTILEEYEHLKTLASTPEGWNEIERIWLDLHPQSDIRGFAIGRYENELDLLDYEIGSGTEGFHYDVMGKLANRLCIECELLVEGRIACIDGWQWPWIMLFMQTTGLAEVEAIKEIDSKILKLGIGLPLFTLTWDEMQTTGKLPRLT